MIFLYEYQFRSVSTGPSERKLQDSPRVQRMIEQIAFKVEDTVSTRQHLS